MQLPPAIRGAGSSAHRLQLVVELDEPHKLRDRAPEASGAIDPDLLRHQPEQKINITLKQQQLPRSSLVSRHHDMMIHSMPITWLCRLYSMLHVVTIMVQVAKLSLIMMTSCISSISFIAQGKSWRRLGDDLTGASQFVFVAGSTLGAPGPGGDPDRPRLLALLENGRNQESISEHELVAHLCIPLLHHPAHRMNSATVRVMLMDDGQQTHG